MKTKIILIFILSSFCYGASFSLPIWKEEAEKKGYKLPKPFGLNVSYMNMKQGFMVDSIALPGVDIKSKINSMLGPILGSYVDHVFGIKELKMTPHDNGSQTNEVFSIRADVWLFPFLNFYAVVGRVQGDSTISVDYELASKRPLPSAIGQMFPIKGTIDSFALDLKGNLYGGGFVLATGYKDIFAIMDFSYTKTNLTVVNGGIDAFVATPRIGYNFQKYLPLKVWIGAMYQEVEQEISGNLNNLSLPFDKELTKDGSYEVVQHLTTKWNTTLGAQYELHPNFNILVEAGFGDRRSIFATLDIRY